MKQNSKRIVGFDYLRSLCAIVVVALHSVDTNSITKQIAGDYFRFPVPIFLVISFFLLFQRPEIVEKPLVKTGWKRFQRITPQFVIWTIFYLFARHLGGNLQREQLRNEIVNSFLLGSSSMQLYYIPLLLYFTILILPVIKAVKFSTLQRATLLLGGLLLFSMGLLYLYLAGKLPGGHLLFIYYAVHNLPFALIGVFTAYRVEQKRSSAYQLIGLFLLLSILFAVTFLLAEDSQAALYNFRLVLIVGLLFTLGYCLVLPENQIVNWISKISFGIYLCHPLFIEGIQRFETKLSLDQTSFGVTIANFLFGCTSAIVLSSLLFRFKPTRFLVL